MNFKMLPCVAFTSVMSIAVMNSSSASDGTVPSQSLYSQLVSFHGHICAGSIFGARLGLAAKEALKAAGGTGKFTARYYDLSCPVDGIQMAAGAAYSNKALKVQDREEHRLMLTAGGNKRAVEAHLTKKAEELGLKSRYLWEKANTLPTGSPERVQIEQEIEEIFSWLKSAPAADVVTIISVKGKNENL